MTQAEWDQWRKDEEARLPDVVARLNQHFAEENQRLKQEENAHLVRRHLMHQERIATLESKRRTPAESQELEALRPEAEQLARRVAALA